MVGLGACVGAWVLVATGVFVLVGAVAVVGAAVRMDVDVAALVGALVRVGLGVAVARSGVRGAILAPAGSVPNSLLA